MTNRMDLMWLFLPALVQLTIAEKRWRLRPARGGGGLAPFLLLEAFSILFFGFAFPNSAYAKLTTGVPWRQLMVQGEYYLLNSLAWDPVTLFGIAVLVGFVLIVKRDDRRLLMVSLGIVLYLSYTVKIGGDYMS